MALTVPSTQTISDQIIAAIETEIGKSISLLPKSFTRVLSKALAGLWTLNYKYAAWSHVQKFVAYAAWDETDVNGRTLRPLVEWGRLVGVGDPTVATNATLTVSFGVLNTDSSTLPAGTQLVHPSSGIIYITLSDVVLDGDPETVDVLAASDPNGNGGSGVQGNREDGDVLEWANPIAQLDAAGGATVTATVTTAADGETEGAYRERVIERFGGRAEGGAYADYRAWALETEGIINAYVYTGDSPGQVDVYIEATEASSGSEDGIPTEAQKEAVDDLIELDSSGLATRRPVSALHTVYGISRQGFDVEVNGLEPDEAETRTIIDAALDDYFRAREPFILGLSKLPRADRVTIGAVAGVVDEAAATTGATVTTTTLSRNGAPISAWTLSRGQKAKLSDATYT